MEFLSRKDLLSFRAATTILGYLDVIEQRGDVEPGKLLRLENYEHSGRDSEVHLYSKLSHFANILVREHEVLTVVPAWETAETVEITAAIEQLYVTRNSRSNEHASVEINKTPKLTVSINTGITATIPLLSGKKLQSEILSLLSKDVSFEAHVANVLNLIKNSHASEQTGEDSIDFWNLCSYVYLYSSKKIFSRFGRGFREKGKNFWKFLAGDFPEQSDTVESHMLSDSLPNAEQQGLLEWILQYDKLFLKACLESPVYDLSGRRRFHRLLRERLECAKNSVKKVQDAVEIAGRSHVLDNNREKATYYLVFVALNATRKLDRFLVKFKTEVTKHLEFLSFAWNLRRTTVEGREVYSRTGTHSPSMSPTDSRTATSSHQTDEPSTYEDKLVAGMDAIEWDDEAMELENLQFQFGGSWSAAALKYLQLTCLHYTGLKEIGIKADSKSSNNNRLSSFIQKITITTVRVVPEFKDMKMMTINKFLENFEPDKQKRDTIKKWLKGHTHIPKTKVKSEEGSVKVGMSLDKEKFLGTWHCETILLSLYALMLTHQEVAPNMSYDELARVVETDTSSLIPPDVFARFTNIKSLLMVSKRCCPACNQLVLALRQEQSRISPQTTVIYPGYHTMWSQVALPPWLPRKFADQVVDHAHTALRERFERLLSRLAENKNTRKRSHSPDSVGQPPPTKTREVFKDIGAYDDSE